jgi:hypothetical protein
VPKMLMPDDDERLHQSWLPQLPPLDNPAADARRCDFINRVAYELRLDYCVPRDYYPEGFEPKGLKAIAMADSGKRLF